MTMSAVVVFVYFRARPADDERVATALAALRARIRERLGPGMPVRFGHRRQEASGQRTWLEIHELPDATDAAGLLALRAECAAALGLDRLIDGAAHVEVFDIRDDAPCA